MSQQQPKGMDPSDAESMLASALLEIRSDARGEIATAKQPQVTEESKFKRPASVQQSNSGSPAAKKRTLSPRKAVPNPIAPSVAPMQQQPAPLVSAPMPYQMNGGGFTQEQLSALRVAAAASAASFAAAASNPLGHMNLIQQAAMSNQGLPMLQRRQGPISHQAIAPASGQSVPSTSHQQQQMTEQPNTRPRTDSMIRRDQVEAALRSKPQRGRKREDLSELERLELTRTRNREHAKSTRIRKKARYQELLDIEKKFEDMEEFSALSSKRRAAIVQFLKARETMLRHVRPSDSCSHSSGELTAPVNNGTAQPTSPGEPPVPSTAWEELVEDPSLFHFDEGWPRDDTTPSFGAERMRRFDEYVQSCVVSKFGNSVVPLLSFMIKGGEAGVALDESNGGLVEVEVALAGPTKVLLMTGMVRFQFGQDSDKLRAVSHVNAIDFFASAQRLQAQNSHPSTVSLDPVLGADSAPKGDVKQDDTTGGPGMNI